MTNNDMYIPAGYKLSELGVIPQEWEVKRLGDVVKYKKGFAFKNTQYTNSGIRIIRISDTDSNGIKDCESIFLSNGEYSKYSDYRLFENDILVQTVGSRPPLYDSMVGKTIKVDRLNNGALLNQNLVMLKPDNIHNYLLFLNLKSSRYLRYIETIVRGNANQVSITLDDLFQYELLLPSLEEQERIAEIFGTWDRAIELQGRKVALLQSRKRALMQQLLTPHRRLPNFSNEIGNQTLKQHIYEVSERNKKQSNIPVLSVTNSRGFINQSEQFDREVASSDSSNYKIVRKGQFAYNPSRVNVGSLDLLRSFEMGILSPMYVVFRTNEKSLDSTYLYYILKSDWFTAHIPMYVQGSVRDSLSFGGLKNMKFFIPSLDEQRAIAEVLTTADREIELATQNLTALSSQKRSLMQQLLTGKKQVKI